MELPDFVSVVYRNNSTHVIHNKSRTAGPNSNITKIWWMDQEPLKSLLFVILGDTRPLHWVWPYFCVGERRLMNLATVIARTKSWEGPASESPSPFNIEKASYSARSGVLSLTECSLDVDLVDGPVSLILVCCYLHIVSYQYLLVLFILHNQRERSIRSLLYFWLWCAG